MSALASDLARALDPMTLAAAAGIDPDPWQVDLLRTDAQQAILNCSRRSWKRATTAMAAWERPRPWRAWLLARPAALAVVVGAILLAATLTASLVSYRAFEAPAVTHGPSPDGRWTLIFTARGTGD
jgi:hypothetical protein